jgi:hypothetical protein
VNSGSIATSFKDLKKRDFENQLRSQNHNKKSRNRFFDDSEFFEKNLTGKKDHGATDSNGERLESGTIAYPKFGLVIRTYSATARLVNRILLSIFFW